MNVRTEGNAPLPLGGYGCRRLLAWSIGKPRPRCREWDARGRTKREGATGSLAIVASGNGPSHPRRLHHGSRLPAMSRVGPQALWKARKPVGWFLFR